ncbi:alpha/beta hydrolase family protein [Urechidicola croceus]|uniref:AB hydrolase-1 domain-containing protein n=1 Tax=Urechidicola croceus TaxID=1850246 RepID=A0A1D8P5N4_9FLAO|nr:alpha/beta fold hydrolase [Urechidicola croceus]AOW19898.1 hypothetical protein LPB138_04025 [Urechidicola croceus]
MIYLKTPDSVKIAVLRYNSLLKPEESQVLIINSATGVNQKFYKNYAKFLTTYGYNVITYDYRGVAASRPKKLRGFKANLTDWGGKDFPEIINYCRKNFPNQKLHVFGHSIGGTLPGFTEMNKVIDNLVTIGSQTAYYKDWSPSDQKKLYFLWHLIFPFISNIIGYFPGKFLKQSEDLPKGVVNQWHSRRLTENMEKQLNALGHETYFNKIEVNITTVYITDDSIGTKKALNRLIKLYSNAKHNFVELSPESIKVEEIGHFGFFSRKFKKTLWKQSLNWF